MGELWALAQGLVESDQGVGAGQAESPVAGGIDVLVRSSWLLVAALISVAAIAAMGIIGQTLQNKMTIVANGFN